MRLKKYIKLLKKLEKKYGNISVYNSQTNDDREPIKKVDKASLEKLIDSNLVLSELIIY